ncbi:MAG: TIGR03617 family F420-dependent LLM class oxidoreductase [Candidatus Limnocylindrales bacterium]
MIDKDSIARTVLAGARAAPEPRRLMLDIKLDTDAPGGLGPIVRRFAALGVDGMWIPETRHDPFISSALAAGHDGRTLLGTNIALAFPRSPMVTAISAWDVQRLSSGRFVLGLGSQVRRHIEGRFAVAWSPPAERMRDYIGAVRAIWRTFQNGEPLLYRGPHYSLDLMAPTWDPGPLPSGPPPIFMAAVGPQMVIAAAELADGILLHPIASRRYIDRVMGPIHDRSGGAPRTVVATAVVGIGGNAAEIDAARARVRKRVAFYAATPSYRSSVLAVHGWEEIGRNLSGLARAGHWDRMAADLPDDVLDEFAIVGTAEEAGQRIHARYGGLVDRVIVDVEWPRDLGQAAWAKLLAAAGMGRRG